jgi:uncharacterized protein YbbC (DUF1343 family)
MVITGLERWLHTVDIDGHMRIALIVNQTSVTSDLCYSWHVLRQRGIAVRRIFTPEHGLFGAEQDQVPVIDQPGGPEIISLYGNRIESLTPAGSWFEDIDMVVFDIQDIGCRYYTYVNTLMLFMEAAAASDAEIVVLDRPNPLGGELIEGSGLEPAFHSFVGVLPVPVCHGLTAGELALYYRDHKTLNVKLKVVAMTGWKRSMRYHDTGLPWVPPSPNMPTPETALVYPGTCLFEGMNISEGRGTTTPFLIAGAPFIDPEAWIAVLDAFSIPGIQFRPVYFKPTFHKYAGEMCGGLFLHVQQPEKFEPFYTGLAMAAGAFQLMPEQVRFKDDVYEFNHTKHAFDLLAGSDWYRLSILSNQPVQAMRDRWQESNHQWQITRKPYLLYDT